MIKLLFKGGSEIVRLDIDRIKREFYIASSKTRYKLKKMDWKFLFDKGKERIQDRITTSMDDKLFCKCIIITMAQKGYEFKKYV